MLDKNKNDLDDTVTDLEFALKRERLNRKISSQTNLLTQVTAREEKVRLQQEILILKQQLKQLTEEYQDFLIDGSNSY